jgi:hypothetical protein
MATSSNSGSTTTSTPDLVGFEGALKHWTDASRKATQDVLDLYLKTIDEFAAAEVKAAKATKVAALATIAEAHAGVSRDVAGTYVNAVRDVIKA